MIWKTMVIKKLYGLLTVKNWHKSFNNNHICKLKTCFCFIFLPKIFRRLFFVAWNPMQHTCNTVGGMWARETPFMPCDYHTFSNRLHLVLKSRYTDRDKLCSTVLPTHLPVTGPTSCCDINYCAFPYVPYMQGQDPSIIHSAWKLGTLIPIKQCFI